MSSPSSLTDSTSPWHVFLIFLRLGLTSFGGPVAHLGYFRDEFVHRRRWLSDASYADLVALCQFLPGPASSQVGLALGLSRSGYAGALAAWCGFTLPSALCLIALALGAVNYGTLLPPGVLQGLKVVAVAVVVQAVWGMARTLCPDASRITLMVASACAVLLWPVALGQVVVILLTGLIGVCIFRPAQQSAHESLPITVSVRAAVAWLVVFVVLLSGLPLLVLWFPDHWLALIDIFYRAGSLVFGGGHVVLPLLQAEVVTDTGVSASTFLAGYGVTQAMPGPLFTFAAFLGAAMPQAPNGWWGGILALIAIFLPSFLLVAGALPFWEKIRHMPRVQAALMGVNAGVVGLLLAALYQPVWTSAVHTPFDYVSVLVALVALMAWKCPAWLVVVLGAFAGGVLGSLM